MPDEYYGDSTLYSVWISTAPYNPSGNQFVHVCSDAKLDYNISYGGNTTGILGQTTSDAIFIDTTGGAVGNFQITGVRLNPISSTENNGYSNSAFYNVVKQLIEATNTQPFRGGQMLQNAYVLRIFRSDVRNSSTYSNHKDMYVFIKDFTMSFDVQAPNVAQISISGYKRNLGKGFGGV